MRAPHIGELSKAMYDGYRITVHDRFFPYESTDPQNPGTVHAVIDHGARAIFCSKSWHDSLPRSQ